MEFLPVFYFKEDPDQIRFSSYCLVPRPIFCNGKTSWNYYKKYQETVTGIPAVSLPSTSPANAAWTLEKLKGAWDVISDYLK